MRNKKYFYEGDLSKSEIYFRQTTSTSLVIFEGCPRHKMKTYFMMMTSLESEIFYKGNPKY